MLTVVLPKLAVHQIIDKNVGEEDAVVYIDGLVSREDRAGRFLSNESSLLSRVEPMSPLPKHMKMEMIVINSTLIKLSDTNDNSAVAFTDSLSLPRNIQKDHVWYEWVPSTGSSCLHGLVCIYGSGSAGVCDNELVHRLTSRMAVAETVTMNIKDIMKTKYERLWIDFLGVGWGVGVGWRDKRSIYRIAGVARCRFLITIIITPCEPI